MIAMVLEPKRAKRFRGKFICMCRVINGKIRLLVLPLGLAQVLHDDYVFLVMGIIKCNNDAGNTEGTMLEEHSC